MKAAAYIVHRAMCEPTLEFSKPKDCLNFEALYKKRKWVGLTNEQRYELANQMLGEYDLMEAVEAKLKELNT